MIFGIKNRRNNYGGLVKALYLECCSTDGTTRDRHIAAIIKSQEPCAPSFFDTTMNDDVEEVLILRIIKFCTIMLRYCGYIH
jgi:hypothetical protein